MKMENLREEINQKRQDDHAFIKWWRREHDFLNFELLERFLDHDDEEDVKWLEGYELLTTDQMWQELKDRAGDRVERIKRTKAGDIISWQRKEKGEQTCPYSPESIMTIFDVETRGNVID